MDKAKIELVRSWLVKADHDLKTAQIISSAKQPLLDTAIYHCQQAAEKAIKGFLTFYDIRFEKTHDIVALLNLASQKGKDKISHYLDMGSHLTPYASEFRYPGDEAMPEKEEFNDALKYAKEIYEMILSLLPPETHPQKNKPT